MTMSMRRSSLITIIEREMDQMALEEARKMLRDLDVAMPAGTPLYADAAKMQELFGVGEHTLAKLRRLPGFPYLKVGVKVLYDVPKSYAWLAEFRGGSVWLPESEAEKAKKEKARRKRKGAMGWVPLPVSSAEAVSVPYRRPEDAPGEIPDEMMAELLEEDFEEDLADDLALEAGEGGADGAEGDAGGD